MNGVGYVAQEIRSTSVRQSPLSVIQIQSISVKIEKDDLLLEKRFFLLLHKFAWKNVHTNIGTLGHPLVWN